MRSIVSSISNKFGINIIRNWDDAEAERVLKMYPCMGAAIQMHINFDRESLAVNNEASIEWTAEVIIE